MKDIQKSKNTYRDEEEMGTIHTSMTLNHGGLREVGNTSSLVGGSHQGLVCL